MSPGQDQVRVNRSLTIPMGEIEWRALPPGGPGGQHANRTRSRVEVSFDVVASRSLGPRQRARLLQRFGPVVRATASEDRSQARNRELAVERLRLRLAEALRPVRHRRPTQPTRASTERRLQEKRERSEAKRRRRSGRGDLEEG